MDETIKNVTAAEKLHNIFTDLWPLLKTKNVAVVVDSAAWSENSVAFHLDNPEVMDKYFESLPSYHPALALDEPLYPAHLIVIDHQAAMAGGGWNELLLTGLHEFAHAIRSELGDGLYPDFHRLKKIGDYLESQLGEHMGTDAAPPDTLLVTDDLMSQVDRHLFPADGAGTKPLFGNWVVRTFQHDGGHDLLYYLVLYLLEREATDRGYFENFSEVNKSVFMPGRVDAFIG